MSWLCDANSERTQIPSQRLLTSLEPNRCFLTHLRCRGAHKGTYHTNGPSYPLQGRQIIQITKGLLDTISYKQNAAAHPSPALRGVLRKDRPQHPPCASSPQRLPAGRQRGPGPRPADPWNECPKSGWTPPNPKASWNPKTGYKPKLVGMCSGPQYGSTDPYRQEEGIKGVWENKHHKNPPPGSQYSPLSRACPARTGH